ncbi:MAG: hypothetical protein WBO12_12240, partial [Xanthobacteraceae bacterium]
MRDPQVPLDLRIEMATQAAPFVTSGEQGGRASGGLRILGLSKKMDGLGCGRDLLGCRKDSCQLMAAAAAQ